MSKFLSLVLRHRPQEIGLQLDPGGWVSLEEVVDRSRIAAEAPITEARIRDLVESQEKPRFTISNDGEEIRANYGHSVEVDLDLEPMDPPQALFHGTAARALEKILQEGLKPGSRQHVHLSESREDALEVGRRHGRPRILRVDAHRMRSRGHRFYRAAEGIWLTPFVPPDHLEVVDD